MKTIEEAAHEYGRIVEMRPIDQAIAKIGFKSGAEWMKKEIEFAQRWIPVEEELPDIKGQYICKHSNGQITIGNYSETFGLENRILGTIITHWRPIELK